MSIEDTEIEECNKILDSLPTNINKKKKESRPPSTYSQKQLEIFLDELSISGNISIAAKKAGISRRWPDSHAKKSPEFAKRMLVSTEQFKDSLDYQAWKVAMGIAETVGDSRVLIKLMEANRPEKYKTILNQDNRTQTVINLTDTMVEARRQRRERLKKEAYGDNNQ